MPEFLSDTDDARLLAEERPGDNALAMSVGELSFKLKRMVEGEFGHVRIRGEISGYKRATSGHVYLALKDDAAVIDGVMWKGQVNALAFAPQDGIEVIATGKLTTYPGRSKYQIVIERMELAGAGALMALFEKLKAKLAGEGLFDGARKVRLPYLPQTIGVVTSPTGAVIRDILHRLEDRCPTHVLVWPVKVQGQGAAEEVAAAVRGFDAMPADGPVPRPDLVIVARGGGSIEDLWSFNEEIVVRAVAESSIPVISAVGHETDTTLCDHAADRRAPTPTAAAEMAVPVRAELQNQIDELALRKRRCALRPVTLGRERLEARIQRLPRPEAILATRAQKLDELSDRLRRGLRDEAAAKGQQLQQVAGRLSLPMLRHRVQTCDERLGRAGLSPRLLERRWALARDTLAPVARVLPQLDPRLPLQRGYALVKSSSGKALTSREAASQEPSLLIEFRDGELVVAVGASTGTPSPATPPARKPARPATVAPRQDDLFGS